MGGAAAPRHHLLTGSLAPPCSRDVGGSGQYGPLTATLITLYFGGIVVLQRLFDLLTGQKSTLAVVASTLLIAALFNPLRVRI